MSPTRSLILLILIIATSAVSVCAQRRWERLPPPRDPQFYEPRNKLEEIDGRQGTILIRGFTWVGVVRAQVGSARVEATEIRDTRAGQRATGVIVTFPSADASGAVTETRSMIDYEEIDPLIKALDTLGKTDETITKLSQFEVRYRTRGDFETIVFKQTSGGIAAAIEGGFFDRTRLLLTLEELTKLRWMIAQAKDRLDEAK